MRSTLLDSPSVCAMSSTLRCTPFSEERCDISAVSEAVAREVAACQKWQCAGSNCPLPDEFGNLPAEFEIDHINGDASDSVITNLQALCGICHNKKSSHERQQRLKAAAATRK